MIDTNDMISSLVSRSPSSDIVVLQQQQPATNSSSIDDHFQTYVLVRH
jgi:hypothetical protein